MFKKLGLQKRKSKQIKWRWNHKATGTGVTKLAWFHMMYVDINSVKCRESGFLILMKQLHLTFAQVNWNFLVILLFYAILWCHHKYARKLDNGAKYLRAKTKVWSKSHKVKKALWWAHAFHNTNDSKLVRLHLRTRWEEFVDMSCRGACMYSSVYNLS